MKKVTEVKRQKQTFNLTLSELRKGDWLKLIPESEMVEITYKNHYITISDCEITNLDNNYKYREGEKYE